MKNLIIISLSIALIMSVFRESTVAYEPPLVIEYQTDVCFGDDIGLVKLTVNDIEGMIE